MTSFVDSPSPVNDCQTSQSVRHSGAGFEGVIQDLSPPKLARHAGEGRLPDTIVQPVRAAQASPAND